MKSVGRGRFAATLDREVIVASTRQPLLDGARALLAAGHSPETSLTVQHENATHASFRPARIGKLARLTIEENDRRGLQLRSWWPFEGPAPVERVGQDERNEGEG